MTKQMTKHVIVGVVTCVLMVLGANRSVLAQTTEKPAPIPKPGDVGEIVKLDPALDAIVAVGTPIQKDPGTFGTLVGARTEGPVWSRDGALLFSETLGNVIYRLEANGKSSVWRTKAGYDKDDAPLGTVPVVGGHPGPNGLTLDREGRVLVCEMGNRRITRIEKDGSVTVVADKFEGKRLNRPNDITVRQSDGSIYFTDTGGGNPAMEIKHSSVFRIAPDGKVQMLLEDISPNGIAFSPDEKFLYVTNSLKWMRYPVKSDGTLGPGTLFADMSAQKDVGLGGSDGMKVDKAGNLFATGPGGVWIISPEGKVLGRIRPPLTPMNVAFGGKDGKTLYMTTWTSIYHVVLKTGGKLP